MTKQQIHSGPDPAFTAKASLMKALNQMLFKLDMHLFHKVTRPLKHWLKRSRHIGYVRGLIEGRLKERFCGAVIA
jgi:hypothetical protein